MAALLDVAVLGIGLAVMATVLWVVYRTMDHARLPVIRSEAHPPRATWAGVARYVLLTPVLVSFWLFVLLLLITAVARERNPEQILAAACAVIAGARLLAHVRTDISQELAKTIPIVILGVILIGGQLVGVEAFERTIDAIPWDLVNAYWVGLIIWDLLLTSLWFWYQRRSWLGAGHTPGRLRRVIARWRRVGYSG